MLLHAGKATGKYFNYWNTKNHNNFKQLIDFSKIAEWKIGENPHTKNKPRFNRELTEKNIQK